VIISNFGFDLIKRKLSYPNGFEITSVDNVNMASTGLTTESGISQKVAFIKSNYIYWLDNKTIKRIELSSTSNIEIIYTNNDIVNPVNINYINIALTTSGNNLVFYKYKDATTIGTYTIPISDLSVPLPVDYEPVEIASSSIEAQDIIELDF
jgi:hypothetical protein